MKTIKQVTLVLSNSQISKIEIHKVVKSPAKISEMK